LRAHRVADVSLGSCSSSSPVPRYLTASITPAPDTASTCLDCRNDPPRARAPSRTRPRPAPSLHASHHLRTPRPNHAPRPSRGRHQGFSRPRLSRRRILNRLRQWSTSIGSPVRLCCRAGSRSPWHLNTPLTSHSLFLNYLFHFTAPSPSPAPFSFRARMPVLPTPAATPFLVNGRAPYGFNDGDDEEEGCQL
jgi:hypothetical protein